MTTTSGPTPRILALRAALTGTVACGLGALLCISRYLTLPHALDLDWSRMPWALALFVVVGGVGVGMGVGAATLVAARRHWGLVGMMMAGAIGGALAGVGPGILGIAGFGSMHAPYAGTANIASSILVSAIAFVALWSPQLYPRPASSSALRHLGHATIASVVTLGAFGLVAGALMSQAELVPTLCTFKSIAHTIGLMPLAILGGAIAGSIGGAAIAAACSLVGRMRR